MDDDEVQLISDGDGVAVIGNPDLVDKFLVAEGLKSDDLELGKLRPIVARMAEAAQVGAVLSEKSGRWLKLTEDSAAKLRKFGASTSKETGLMTGVVRADKGRIAKHLQFVPKSGASVLNPAVLSGAGGIMAQMAMEQQMAEITDYLEKIDEKLDDVRRAQKDSVLADLIGVKYIIDEAMEIRNETGRVNPVTWSKVQGSSTTIARTQGYALQQLDALAAKLEKKSKVGELVGVVKGIEASVGDWLVVLAQTFQLQDALGVLELDRVMEDTPEDLENHRLGLRKARDKRIGGIAVSTGRLLERMQTALTMSNRQVVFNPIDSRNVVNSSHRVSGEIVEFQGTLGIEGSGHGDVVALSWRDALAGMKDETLEAGAEGVSNIRRFGDKALEGTKDLNERVRVDLSERKSKRLDKRIEKLIQKREADAERNRDKSEETD